MQFVFDQKQAHCDTYIFKIVKIDYMIKWWWNEKWWWNDTMKLINDDDGDI